MQLGELQIGSPEYRKREEDIGIALCELDEYDHSKQAEFANMSARIKFAVLAEIRNEVKHFAEMSGIDIVLNYDSSKISPDNAENRLGDRVVYQSTRDITEYLHKLLHDPPRPCCLPPAAATSSR